MLEHTPVRHPLFSDRVMDHFRHPRGTGTLSTPDGEGWGGHPDSSRYLRMQVMLDGDRVSGVRFATYGCAPAIACGSWLCEWAVGRPVDEVLRYQVSDLLQDIGDLPPARRFCADMAIDGLRAALHDAQHRRTLTP